MKTINTILIWMFTLALAAGMALSGLAKFQDVQGWSLRFEEFGVSSELLLITAAWELIGAVLLLIPRLASYGAAILAVIMGVAVWAHLHSGVGDPSTAIAYFLAAVVLLALRLPQLLHPFTPRKPVENEQ